MSDDFNMMEDPVSTDLDVTAVCPSCGATVEVTMSRMRENASVMGKLTAGETLSLPIWCSKCGAGMQIGGRVSI